MLFCNLGDLFSYTDKLEKKKKVGTCWDKKMETKTKIRYNTTQHHCNKVKYNSTQMQQAKHRENRQAKNKEANKREQNKKAKKERKNCAFRLNEDKAMCFILLECLTMYSV